MGRKATLHLDADTDEKLTALAEVLGYSREMAAVYAVRVICACAQEGLLRDLSAWPVQAREFAGNGPRAAALPFARKKSGKKTAGRV